MYNIKWRKWELEDFLRWRTEFIFCQPRITKQETEFKSLLENLLLKNKQETKFKLLVKDLILENEHEKLIEKDTTTLLGFSQSKLLQFKNKEDIKKNNNLALKEMLNKIEQNVLIIPAPLCELYTTSSRNEIVLIDGNHRSAFAKIMNIPIKAQVLKPTATLVKFKESLSIYNKMKNFIDSIKKDSII